VKHLSLHFNALPSLPAGIAGCQELVWLSLNANRLTALPEEICSMTALVRLSLHINQVSAQSFAAATAGQILFADVECHVFPIDQRIQQHA
jgi:Leucine-rich repeat (LRR) protein